MSEIEDYSLDDSSFVNLMKTDYKDIWNQSGTVRMIQDDGEWKSQLYEPEQVKLLNNGSRKSNLYRMEEILRLNPAFKKLALREKPVTLTDRFFKNVTGERGSWIDDGGLGEQPLRLIESISSFLFKPQKSFTESEFDYIVNTFTKQRDDGFKGIKDETLKNPSQIKTIKKIDDWLNTIGDRVEISDVNGDKYVTLKEEIPFSYSKSDDIIKQPVTQKNEPSSISKEIKSLFEKINKTSGEKADEIKEKYYQIALLDETKAAYDNYLRNRPVEYFENFAPTEKFTDTLFGLIPEIAKLGVATLTGIGTSIATKSTKAGRAAGFGVYQSLTAPQIAKAEYDESMDFFKKNGANDQLAKELSAKVAIHNVVINAGLERLAVGRYFKQIVPPKFQNNFIKQQAEAARNRILKNTVAGTIGLESIKGALREGIQEEIQYLSSAAIQAGYKNNNFMENVDAQEAWDNFYGGAMFGGVFGAVGGKFSLNNNPSNDLNFDSSKKDLTLNSESDVPNKFIPNKNIVKPTNRNYLMELVTAGEDNQVVIDKSNTSKDNPNLTNIINNIEKVIGNTDSVERFSYVLKELGPKVLKELSLEDKKLLNNQLEVKMEIMGTDSKYLSKNLLKDIAEGKITISKIKATNNKVDVFPEASIIVSKEIQKEITNKIEQESVKEGLKGEFKKDFIKQQLSVLNFGENTEPSNVSNKTQQRINVPESDIIASISKTDNQAVETEGIGTNVTGGVTATGETVGTVSNVLSANEIRFKKRKIESLTNSYITGKSPKNKSYKTALETINNLKQELKTNNLSKPIKQKSSSIKSLKEESIKGIQQQKVSDDSLSGAMDNLESNNLESNDLESNEDSKQPSINKTEVRKNSELEMAKIEKIKGVDIIRVGLPVKGGLERIGDIKVAKNKQGKGLASTWVKNLLIRRKTQNRETVDIIAKPGSEGFWEKQGFKVYDSTNEYFGKDADGKQDKLLVEKGELFKKELTDKDGKLKKVDGKTPTPMIFDLRNISLQDLIVQSESTLKDKPIKKPDKPKSEIDILVDEFVKNRPKTVSGEISNSIDELFKGFKEIDNEKGYIRYGSGPELNSSEKTSYNRAKVHFDKSYESLKNAYNILLEDYVNAMFKALKKLPKKTREALRRYLMNWANSKDKEIYNKINLNNRNLNIVELMGFGNKQKILISKQIMGDGTLDSLIESLDNENELNSDGSTKEGLNIADISDNEEIGNNLTFEGYDFRGDQFIKFLELTDTKGYLSLEETAKLISNVKIGDKEIFLQYLKEKFKFVPSTIAESNLVQSFFVRNQTINRTSGAEKPSWWWANIDYEGKLVSNKKNKKLIPKIGGNIKWGKDIRNNTDLPKTLNMSFVDWELQQNNYEGSDIKISRIYLKDLVDVWVGNQVEQKYYGKPSFSNLTDPNSKESLINKWDKIFASPNNNDSNGNPIIRTVAEIKGGGNSPSFIVARVPMDIIDISKDTNKIKMYFKKEIDSKNITLDMAKEFIQSIKELNVLGTNPYVISQIITQHELMKRAHGAKYLMRTSDILHHMKRASLPYGEGVVPVGIGDNTIKIIDQTKVSIINEAGNKIPMTEYLTGLENYSRSDGATITESELLDSIAKQSGREELNNGLPMREVKTVIWFSSLNDKFSNKHYNPIEYEDLSLIEGEHYLAIKHNEFVAEEGFKFVDEDDNIIAYTVKEDRHIRIYDNEDNRINRIATLDEAKEPDGGSGVFKLDGRVATDILTLPEKSTRVIKLPSQKSKRSSAFPMTWLSKLSNSEFDKLRNTIEDKLILPTARANVKAMFDARKNKEIMAALFGTLKSNNASFPNEIDQLIEPEPGKMLEDGYNLPHISKGVLEPIKNKIIRENAYMGRRQNLGNYPTLKPDYDGTKVLEKNGIAISEDDSVMVNFVKRKLNLDIELTGKDLQNAFNEAYVQMNLKNKGVYLLVSRQPVYKANGVVLAKITNVIPSGQGNVLFLHPELASGPLQADSDGDAVQTQILYLGENFQDESIVNAWLGSQKFFDKRAGYSRVEYFKKGKRNFPATSKESMYQASKMLGSGLASQGIFTNAINFFEDMHFKEIKLEIGGQSIVTRNPETGKVIMDYAPLNDDVTQEMLNDSNMGELVDEKGNKWKSGEKYLLTSPLTQLEILLQSSVDHAKELLLFDWGYTGYDWVIPKIFIQENGSPIGKKQSNTISKIVRKLLTYNNLRYVRDMDTRQSQGIDSLFNESKKMYELNILSAEERGEQIKLLANTRRTRFNKINKESSLSKSTFPIDKIMFNNKLTSIEKLIAIPYEEMLKYQKENPNDIVNSHPWGYVKHQVVNGLSKTQSELLALQKSDERFYPENKSWDSKKLEADVWLLSASEEFYGIHRRALVMNNNEEKSLNSASYPYNEEMLDFIDNFYNGTKNIKGFKNLTKEQQAYTTLSFLRGARVKQRILKSSPLTNAIIKKINENRERIQIETDKGNFKNVEILKKGIKTLNKKLDDITTKTFVEKQAKIRDVQKLFPMQLMDKDVWRTYANLAGDNIRKASTEKIPLTVKKEIENQLLRDCIK